MVDFYKMETIYFNIIRRSAVLFVMKEVRNGSRQIQPFVALSYGCFRADYFLSLVYISVRVERTCQTCYRYYCPSLITAPQLSELPRPPSEELRQMITIIQSDIYVNSRHS
jgi:hypothetical protein